LSSRGGRIIALALTELDAYVYQDIIPKTTDIIYASSPVFSRLESQNHEPFTGNSRVQRPVIVGELNGDFLQKGDTVDISFVTTDAAIVADMKVAWVNITLFGYDAMNDDGPEAIFNQVEMKFLNASLKMAKILATNMYLNGQNTRVKYLNGFDEWFDDGTTYPTVGGQTRTDINGIANGTVGGLNAYTATLTTFTLAQLNTAYGNACWGSDHPDLLPVTQNGWNLIWQATQPNMRYANTDNDLANVGFQNFKFNAADVVIDRYLPTGSSPIGKLYGFNTSYIEWYFSAVKLFQYGWTGFKGTNNSIDVSGQFLVGSNILCPSPRTSFKLSSTLF
jgi:hypothetical protein